MVKLCWLALYVKLLGVGLQENMNLVVLFWCIFIPLMCVKANIEILFA